MLANLRIARKIDIGQMRERVRRFAQSERGRDEICLVLIFLLVSVMLRRCLYGDPPIGHDHPVHLARIWQFGHTLLRHPLAPWTWSHLWFAGYPQNVVYPIGADLLVLGIRALSLGTLSLTSAYGLAFFLFYFAYGASLYLFVRRAVDSRIAALLAAIFLLTDPGSNDTGGWFWIVDLGVWANSLGMIPVLIALLQINALFEKIDNRRIALAAACIGAAFLCHPLHLIFVAVAVPLLCLARFLNGQPTRWLRSLGACALIIFIGTLIASYWLVPYVAAAPYAAAIGKSGLPLHKIGSAFVDAKVFERMNPFAAALGFIGILAFLAARRTLALFMSIFVFAAFFLASSNFTAIFSPQIGSWLSKHIIATRLLLLAKPFWYGAAGFAIVAIGRAIRSLGTTNTPMPARVRYARGALVVILAGPIAFYFVESFIKTDVKRPSKWLSDRDNQFARDDFVAWAHASLDRQPGFFRIAYDFQHLDHDLADLALELPYPLYEVEPTPTGHFKYDVHASTAAAFRAVNVRFALVPGLLPEREDLTLQKIFRNKLFLYEFRYWNPKPFEINGTGAVEVVSWADDEIVLRAPADAAGTLRLNVSAYPKWRATLDGVPLPITPATVAGVDHCLMMNVPLHPGTIRFRFVRGFTDYIGTVFAVIGLVSCGMIWKSERSLRRLEVVDLKRPPAAREENGKKREI